MTTAVAPDQVPDPAPPRTRDRGWRREALIALAVAAVLTVLGLPIGMLWRAIAPQVEFVMTDQGATTLLPEPEGFAADDGWYVLITFAVGVLAAIAVWVLLRRCRGPLMLLGLVVGCVLAGWLTSWLGHTIGYDHFWYLAHHAPVGTHFFRPPDVRSGYHGLWHGFLPRLQGAILVQAVAAAMTYLMLAAFHVDPDLRPPTDVVEPVDDPGEPDGEISSEPTEWPTPSQTPARPESDPAASPHD